MVRTCIYRYIVDTHIHTIYGKSTDSEMTCKIILATGDKVDLSSLILCSYTYFVILANVRLRIHTKYDHANLLIFLGACNLS